MLASNVVLLLLSLIIIIPEPKSWKEIFITINNEEGKKKQIDDEFEFRTSKNNIERHRNIKLKLNRAEHRAHLEINRM